MAKRSIEETFRMVKPKGQKGIPSPPTIGVGVSSNDGDFTTALSQAGQQISQLQAAYQQQASLIQSNTQAIQGNTSAQSSRSALGTAGGIASGMLGGFGLLSPIISGIASLFGGGSSAPPPLPIYTPPPPVSISGMLNAAAPATPASQPAPAQQVTVYVNALDSQSFLDHSDDIANAVREAMLNMHPINGVIASI
jgi:hypothetical protein